MAEPFQANPYARSPFDGPLVRSKSLVMPIVIYGLYLFALFTGGISMVLGVVLAYVLQGEAGPVARSHYVFQIRTFWWGIGLIVLGVPLAIIGIPLMFVLIGFPIMLVGGLLAAGAHFWQIVRCIVGIVRAAGGEPYPYPRTMLV